MIKPIIEKLPGLSDRKNETLYISVPTNPVDNQLNVFYHGKTVEATATKLGYVIYPIDKGLQLYIPNLATSISQE